MSLARSILHDFRLTADARLVALAILDSGRDWVSVPLFAVTTLLDSADEKDRRARRALRELRQRGIVERRAGGRGHPDAYRVVPLDSVENSREATERASFGDPARKFRPPRSGESKRIDPPKQGSLKAPVRKEDRQIEEEGGSSFPQSGPFGLAPEVADFIQNEHGEEFAGCRGALSDYLAARVPLDRQKAFAASVLSWLNGLDPTLWKKRDGSTFDPEKRVGMIAVALNELGASDEDGRKHPVADPRNLRNKLAGLVRATVPPPDASRTFGRNRSRGEPGGSRYIPLTPYREPERTGEVARIDLSDIAAKLGRDIDPQSKKETTP